MTLGQNIQNARRAQGLSQEALAEKSASAARPWASGRRTPPCRGWTICRCWRPNWAPAWTHCWHGERRPRRACRDAGCTAGPAGRPRRRGKRRRRLWGCAGARRSSLAGLLAGVALQYERQISTLNQNYAAIQSSYAAQQAELSAQISNCRTPSGWGEATVLDWLAAGGQAAPGRR